jgi:anhydro-N-acetylmuramic acid kinase
MSGTSLDGVDVTLCQIDENSCKLLASYEHPFDKKLKDEILRIISNVSTLRQIGEIDSKLGYLFADAINKFVKKNEINKKDIKAIGLHGQTLWHEPKSKFAFSMQLGCPNVVSAKTSLKVIADFRRMDIANGGEGAPFTPAFHKFVFSSLKKRVAVVNIGGMANITLLNETTQGWDVGCGNVLLDLWIRKIKQKDYDKDGEFAKSGKINKQLLYEMMNDEYFKKNPPKSTGREYFNEKWLNKHLIKNENIKNENIKNEDVQRTLLELTALSIVNDLKDKGVELLIVCGGGVKNNFLMQRLNELCKCEVKKSDEFGISSQYLESMAFAWLGYKRLKNEVVELKDITGAKKNSILGGIYG